VESAIPAISPTDENVHGDCITTVQPEYSRRWSIRFAIA
jgi:hypothetical protein